MTLQNQILVELLWKEKSQLFNLRKPSWVLRSLGVILTFSLLVLLFPQMNKVLFSILIIDMVIYSGYSVFTYFVIKKWPNEKKFGKEYSIVVLMAFDGLGLFSVSLLSLIFSNQALYWVAPEFVPIGWILSIIISLFSLVYIYFRRHQLLGYLLEADKKSFPAETKITLSIPGIFIGLAIAFATIFRESNFLFLLSIGLGYLLSFILLAISTMAFFQVLILKNNIKLQEGHQGH